MARGLKAVVSNKMPRWKLLKGHVMAEKDLGDLFLHTLKDVYFAEQ
jgi:hypothetical protein